MQNWIRFFRNHLDNISGKGIGGRCVVFESDDWGSLRMPSREVFNQLPASAVGRNPFNYYDTLDSVDDLEDLFLLLRTFRDTQGNHPVITGNFVMGNPDFDRIRKNRYQEYFWEPVETTYDRYKKSSGVLTVVKQGIKEGLFFPQFHAREHVNAYRWLSLIREGSRDLQKAFDKEVFCVDLKLRSLRRNNLMASFDYDDLESRDFLGRHLQEGTAAFDRVFGFSSKSFIAPCNVWDHFVEENLKHAGVTCIQSLRVQQIPVVGHQPYRRKKNVMGSHNSLGQIYTVRNVYFEPATRKNYDWVLNAMNKIAAAFFWNQPAIISTHRINYVGGLEEQNRKKGLKLLNQLLTQIVKTWPDVQFLNSVQLADKIASR